ncbi:hypothetical protein [Bacillus sp. NPDC094106]|uniref:BC1872 family protein n=1 Tax=Bacillus sp. NPDC094106 TaxID=3363949 RepID=UPI003814C8D5
MSTKEKGKRGNIKMDIEKLSQKIVERKQLLQALNSEIGTKVMGWSIKIAMDGETEFYDDGSVCGGFWVQDIQKGFTRDESNTFKPSENIKHAWMVLERMKEHHNYLFSLSSIDSNCFKCELRFGNETVEYIDPSECVAICVASLKALMVMNSKQ